MLRKILMGLSLTGLLMATGCHCCRWFGDRRCNTCDPCAPGAVPPPPPPGGPYAPYAPPPGPPVSANFGGPTPDIVAPAQRPAAYYGSRARIYYNP